ncbi:MAG TPA: hypothetical protein VG099_28930 [Gemmataceae bacterium]|jgi:hypothetical protein|nr:hypothetical protein [Gemmataceae bacterium]
MREKIRQELLVRFPFQMQRRLPQFHRVDLGPEIDHFALWAWKLVDDLTLFALLQAFDNRDHFVVEIGWSENGDFPWWTLPSNPPKLEAPRFRLRLARLWATGKLADHWQVVPDRLDAEPRSAVPNFKWSNAPSAPPEVPEDEVLHRVAPLSENAVNKLVEFGLPVFRAVAAHRGVPF